MTLHFTYMHTFRQEKPNQNCLWPNRDKQD